MLHLDYETFSEVDLKKRGLPVYATHDSTEVLTLGWAFDNDPVELWEPHKGPMPREVRRAMESDEILVAWNAAFERWISQHVLGIETPREQWRDPMVMAYALSMPGALETVCKIVGLPPEKQKIADGKRLLRKFSQPRKPTKNKPWTRETWETEPEDWGLLGEYCRQDVDTERDVLHRLRKWPLPKHEWELWFLDQKINDAGLPIDPLMVRNAPTMAKVVRDELLEQANAITGLGNSNSTQLLVPWLQERGYPFDELKKAKVAKAVDNPPEELTAEALEVLKLRQQWSRTSTRKYVAMEKAVNDDGRLRHMFQFAGAGRTWRWAGRRVQLQNLPRPTKEVEQDLKTATNAIRANDLPFIKIAFDNPMDVLSSCLRSAIRAPEGKKLVVADLNAIENRVLGFLADSDRILKVFRDGLCPYKTFGVQMFKVPYEEITKDQRTLSKPGVLGGGYMLGGGDQKGDEKTGLWGYADNMGIKMTRDEAHHSVEVYRANNPEVVRFWDDIDRAVRRCIATKKPQEVGPLVVDISGPFMRIRLPSGRHLHYVRPALKMWDMPWKKKGTDKPDRRISVTYEGLNQTTRKWHRMSTHPGKLTENADQAIARDILAPGLIEADRRGFEVIGHVHDEIVTLVDEDSPLGVPQLCECMAEIHLPWAPDLPLAADGYEDVIFKKD